METNSSDLSQNAVAELSHQIDFYTVPPIVLLGTLGNLLSLAVFRCTKLRRLSTSYYLTALSLSDTAFLICVFAIWVDVIGVPVYHQPYLCQFVTYTSHTCCFLSPWLVVAFTVERFVATCYPLRRAAMCTVSRAKIVVALLTFIACGSYSYIFLMAGVTLHYMPPGREVYRCGLMLDYKYPMMVLNSLDTFFALVIPVVLIIGLNFRIGCAVWHFEQVRRRMTTSLHPHRNGNCSVDSVNSHFSTGTSSHDGSRGASSSGVAHGGQYQIKITKMLLMISSIFVVLNVPSYVMRLFSFHQLIVNTSAFDASDDDDVSDFNFNATTDVSCCNDTTSGAPSSPPEMGIDDILRPWFQLIYYLNFAINFLLYCMCGENFRKSLRHLLWKLVASRRHGDVNVAGGMAGANSSRRQWSRRNTSTVVISTPLLMTETVHSSPLNMAKSRQQNVTSI